MIYQGVFKERVNTDLPMRLPETFNICKLSKLCNPSIKKENICSLIFNLKDKRHCTTSSHIKW